VDEPTCTIDDFGPLPVVRPTSVAELGDMVRRAAADRQALYPLGGRTMLHCGLPPTRPGMGVDVRGLAEVIEHAARDMTITVQAGITIARLQELLRSENQRLPVDVPRAELATLGGALATNASGPRRLGFGTLRDYVIGITVVNDQGHAVKAGGRVVKNVAGYDMCKLYIGALGTLGVITQVTLKLRPLPEESAVVLIGCAPAGVAALLDNLHSSRTRPVCIDLLNDAAAQELNRQSPGLLPETPRVVVVGFEEKRETVGWQVQQLVKELPAGTILGLEARVGTVSAPVWHALTELSLRDDAVLTFKATLLPSATAELVEQAAALPEKIALQAHAGNGIVFGHVAGTLTMERAQTMLTLLQRVAGAAQGNVIVQRCPPAWKAVLPVWGVPRGDAWLMRTVRDKLDPGQLFNPGRFL
jgi:glycolate oxidase FAD binding subunit